MNKNPKNPKPHKESPRKSSLQSRVKQFLSSCLRAPAAYFEQVSWWRFLRKAKQTIRRTKRYIRSTMFLTTAFLLVFIPLFLFFLVPTPPVPNIALGSAFIASIYLLARCTTPPNPHLEGSQRGGPGPSHSSPSDLVRLIASPIFLTAAQAGIYTLGLSHAIMMFTFTPTPSILSPVGLSRTLWSMLFNKPPRTYWLGPYSRAQLCPHRSNLAPELFGWSTHTVGYLCAVLVFGMLRLYAFKALGASFTFRLAKPSKLITKGVYGWIQHPSYTGLIGIMLAAMHVLGRPDGVVGCWLSYHVVRSRYWLMGRGAFVAVMLVVMGLRIRDEEKMMRSTFGASWDHWHKKTSRLIPYIL